MQKKVLTNICWKEKLNYETLMSYFSISCGTALTFYLGFFHFIPLLKESFGYSPGDIIMHNFLLASASFIISIVLVYLSYWIHPLKISKIRAGLALLVMVLLPFLIILQA